LPSQQRKQKKRGGSQRRKKTEGEGKRERRGEKGRGFSIQTGSVFGRGRVWEKKIDREKESRKGWKAGIQQGEGLGGVKRIKAGVER